MPRRSLLVLLALPFVACARPEVAIAPEPDRPATPHVPSPAPLQGLPEQPLPHANNGVLPPGAADRVLPVGGRPIVRLLEPGAEPRSDLSYALSKGVTEKMVMSMDMTMVMKMGGQSMKSTIPRMTMHFDALAAEKNATNEFRVESHLGKIAVEPNGGQEEQMAKAMEPQLQGMKGLGISYWVNPKGQVRDVKLDVPSGMPATAKQLISGMSQSFESMVTPLPTEAVGVGAKWQVITRMGSAGADLLQSAVYTLKSRAGSKATLDVTLVQLSANDTIRGPQMPAGMSARVKRFDSSGSGTSQLDTRTVAPEAGTMKIKTGMDLGVQGGGAAGATEESSIETTTVVRMARP